MCVSAFFFSSSSSLRLFLEGMQLIVLLRLSFLFL